jgi:hypothetical protein
LLNAQATSSFGLNVFREFFKRRSFASSKCCSDV